MTTAYDFVGDVHGYATKLETLLEKLGYRRNGKGFSHPSRRVFFLGDYINRGPEIPRTLEIVKTMIDRGDALGIMGNHEYYAVCFNTPKKTGGYLRRHSIKNILNQYETFRQFGSDEKSYEAYLEWFLTLPLYYEAYDFRAAHACWNADSIATLKQRLVNGRLSRSLLEEARQSGTGLCTAIETTLKGPYLRLPATSLVDDKEQEPFAKMRMKWWEDPAAQTYRSLSVQLDPQLPDTLVAREDIPLRSFYGEKEKPVFFGHYGLTETPVLFRSNVCCLDFGVAKGNRLAAYPFNGEAALDGKNIVWVS